MDVNRRHLIGVSAAGVAGALAVSTDAARAAPLTSALGRDVTQYGVRPGSPDDQTKNLQRAIDEAAHAQVPLALPPGVYRTGMLRLQSGSQLAGVRGAEQVKLETVDMGTVVKETLKRMELMLNQHNAIIVEPDAWLPAQGYGPWLEEVWYNYLSNGLKYGGTPPRLVLGNDQQENDMVRFWIKDNGPGIDPEALEKIFIPFFSTKKTGSGIGLSLSRQIMRQHEGSITVRSTVGEGTEFFLRF